MKFLHAPSTPTHARWASHATPNPPAGPAMLPHPPPLGQLCFHTHPRWAS